MRYGSVCSGIEAATAAWHPLGWEPAFFSEIEAFPRAVLSHHYKDVPLHGDFTTIGADDYGAIDLLVGGTPCQSFSVAGLRKGLDDERGNLALEYLKLAQRKRPAWLVWENVPGVLSSNGGRDFGAFLGGLVELGYGFAYRVLDAQYFGVAQRRRRVFVVGCFGDWRPAAAVLFERHSLQGHPAPSREKGEGAAGYTASSFGGYRDGTGTLMAEGGDIGPGSETLTVMSSGQGNAEIADNLSPTLNCNRDGAPIAFQPRYARNGRGAPDTIAAPLTAQAGKTGKGDSAQCVAIPINTQIATRGGKLGEGTGFGVGDVGDPSFTLQAAHSHVVAFQSNANACDAGHEISPTVRCGNSPEVAFGGNIARTLSARHDSSPCADRGMDVVAFAQNQRDEVRTMDVAGALAAEPGMKQQTYLAQGITIHGTDKTARVASFTDTACALRTKPPGSIENSSTTAALQNMAVRRLTPIECERLQGFSDGYTLIPTMAAKKVEDDYFRYLLAHRPELSRDEATRLSKDGPRYKALGNSMAVPVMRWIGERIGLVSAILGDYYGGHRKGRQAG